MQEENESYLIETIGLNELYETKKRAAIATVEAQYEKYRSDPYMLLKTNNYICNQLPTILENMKRTQVERANRMEEMTNDQDLFIQTFLNNNQYFYVASTEKFFLYDGIHYHLYSEDDILYNVLSSITRDRSLMSWKQRTKLMIMKRIRENSLFKSIPESETIQQVLDAICPTLFSCRTEAKYFLTMLGDSLLKKHGNLIHFIHPNAKHFIREINNISQLLLGVSLSQSIRHKYHEHTYADCRLVKISDSIKSELIWNPILTQYALDMLCVACHYSIRYNSSDEYILQNCNDDGLIAHVFLMRDLSPTSVIEQFVNEYLDIFETSDTTLQLHSTQITWKNMQFLWKHFLDSKNLPSIVVLQFLKSKLTETLASYYHAQTDLFVGIYSKYLPSIQRFLQFWSETMIVDENESELEIEEIALLVRKWSTANSGLNNKQMLDVLSYYHPTLEIDRDKYISKVRCILWDKQMDIQVALENLQETIRSSYLIENTLSQSDATSGSRNISIYDAYLFYCKYHSSATDRKLLVSKSYFEKYVFDHYDHYVVDAKFLSSAWYETQEI